MSHYRFEFINVAVPWSLSHYIPLNGFHPLYRALFDNRLESIQINAWDNVELSQVMRDSSEVRSKVVSAISTQREMLQRKIKSNLASRYLEEYFPPNITLTNLLPGDIEFHHTAPFPSLTRPFVFHCESFAPIFFPFSHQGEGKIMSPYAVRKHYLRILEDPLCLGIFSHISETLSDISNFFDSPDINAKLHLSKIGLSRHSLPKEVQEKRWPLNNPRFLFVNSANQNSANFFHRGGHIVLRFWRELMASGHRGKLYLRCARPSDELLTKHGVDVAFLQTEESRSVIWIQEYLTNQELNALISDVHFLLLPSFSLHSVSIMQAMALGTVPVVSDTVGTSLYVKDDHNGIVLEGVFSTNWKKDPATGVLVDRYHRSKALDDNLVSQLTRRINELLVLPSAFDEMRKNALSCASKKFSGSAFSDEFWAKVQTLLTEHISKDPSKHKPVEVIPELDSCLVKQHNWPRIFESVPHPITRLFSGYGWVTELGGAYIHTKISDPPIELHDWSVLAEFYRGVSPSLYYAISIKALGGRYMAHFGEVFYESRLRLFINWVSRLLMPFSSLHRIAARILKAARKVKRLLSKRDATAEQQLESADDIQLVKRDEFGMNIIRFFDKYFAIPKNEGEFAIAKIESGGYSICFFGNSFEEVLVKIADVKYQNQTESAIHNQNQKPLELIEEDFHGLNIVRFIDDFYALPQSLGRFQYSKFLAGRYKKIYTNESVEGIKMDIAKDRK
jgi:glycosyltransferase involved in cell wall biosynthesis